MLLMRDAGKLLLTCFCILNLWSCSGQELVVQDEGKLSEGHEQTDAPVQAGQHAKSATNEHAITCPQKVDSGSELDADSSAAHFVVSTLK
jgi:hypothetical protein